MVHSHKLWCHYKPPFYADLSVIIAKATRHSSYITTEIPTPLIQKYQIRLKVTFFSHIVLVWKQSFWKFEDYLKSSEWELFNFEKQYILNSAKTFRL